MEQSILKTLERISKLLDENARMRKVLREISLGKGQFDQDHYIHARNTIEDMKQLALDALDYKPNAG